MRFISKRIKLKLNAYARVCRFYFVIDVHVVTDGIPARCQHIVLWMKGEKMYICKWKIEVDALVWLHTIRMFKKITDEYFSSLFFSAVAVRIVYVLLLNGFRVFTMDSRKKWKRNPNLDCNKFRIAIENPINVFSKKKRRQQFELN